VSATHHKLHAIRNKLRAGKRRPKGALNSEINVTPLVDVVLVLLIIFMVVTPMIASGVQVDLPRTMHHNKKPDDGKDIIISVTKTKEIYMSGKRVAKPADLIKLLEEEKRRHPEKTTYLKGDSRATYGAVREVMEAIHKTGVDDVMLGTEEVAEKK
jgi:biopolymer transport protein TolR